MLETGNLNQQNKKNQNFLSKHILKLMNKIKLALVSLMFNAIRHFVFTSLNKSCKCKVYVKKT